MPYPWSKCPTGQYHPIPSVSLGLPLQLDTKLATSLWHGSAGPPPNPSKHLAVHKSRCSCPSFPKSCFVPSERKVVSTAVDRFGSFLVQKSSATYFFVWPPLSAVKSIKVLSASPVSVSAAVMLPTCFTDWSSAIFLSPTISGYQFVEQCWQGHVFARAISTFASSKLSYCPFVFLSVVLCVCFRILFLMA